MDTSEALAERYLKSLHLGSVVYEPDGNIPPDFTVDGHIAVEVRRLNQHYELAAGRAPGLEELDIPLRKRIKKLLRDHSPSLNGECWYVGYGFRRPLEPPKELDSLLTNALSSFMREPSRQRTKLKLTPHFDIDFFRAGVDHGSFFVLGANIDRDSGGWVMPELDRNIRLCIAEKERKIAPYFAKYREWWLILEDRIDYAIDLEDRTRFKNEFLSKITHCFSRVVLLDPRGSHPPFEA
jgi:hypothetical protein